MSSKKRKIAEVVQMYKIRQEEEKCFPESPFRLSFNDPLQENQGNKKGKTNLIFHLYCEGDLPKSKFRLTIYDGKEIEPQDPFTDCVCGQGTKRTKPPRICGENKATKIQRCCLQTPSDIKVIGKINYYDCIWYSYSTQVSCFLNSASITLILPKKKKKMVEIKPVPTAHHSGGRLSTPLPWVKLKRH